MQEWGEFQWRACEEHAPADNGDEEVGGLGHELEGPVQVKQREDVLVWNRHLSDTAVLGGDLLLSAFTGLRRLSTELTELVAPRTLVQGPQSVLLPKMLNNSITAWEQKWLPLFNHRRSF